MPPAPWGFFVYVFVLFFETGFCYLSCLASFEFMIFLSPPPEQLGLHDTPPHYFELAAFPIDFILAFWNLLVWGSVLFQYNKHKQFCVHLSSYFSHTQNISLLWVFQQCGFCRTLSHVFRIVAGNKEDSPRNQSGITEKVPEDWKTLKDFFVCLFVFFVILFCLDMGPKNAHQRRQDWRILWSQKERKC